MTIPPEWFWSRVNVTRRTDECWVWRGQRFPNGYGRINWELDQFLAHRVAYDISYGAIPEGSSVLHRCDYPPCVNPSHLYIGTQTDNMRDCANKGRLSIYAREGVKNPKAKLNEEQVREIRRRHAEGETLTALGLEFKVAIGHIGQIVHRKTWKHI